MVLTFIWVVLLSIVAGIVTFAGTLKVSPPADALRPRAFERVIGLAEVCIAVAIILVNPRASATTIGILFMVYGGLYALLVKSTGSCNCLHPAKKRSGEPPAGVAAGTARRLVTAAVAFGFAFAFPVPATFSTSPLVLAAPVVAVFLALRWPVVERRKHEAMMKLANAAPAEPDLQEDTPQQGGSTRRGFIGGAVASFIGLAIALGFPRPAFAVDCWVTYIYCYACCDDYCPHWECYSDCDVCYNRCLNGYVDCWHTYGCWQPTD